MKPEDGYISYIINPKSGASSSKLLVHQFREYLLEHGYEVRTQLTQSLEHACALATDAAIKHDCALVVASGGDGTIREVAHGLEGSDKPLLIIPGGTENLLASELGFDNDLKKVIKAFNEWYIRPLDMGQANGKCFTSIAGIGFDAEVVHLVNSERSGHIDHLDYFWPLWRTFWEHKFPKIQVEVDGKQIYDGNAMVFVGNISRYAIGLKILAEADYSDGLLDICIYDCKSHLRLLRHSMFTVLKKHKKSSHVVYAKGKNIKITSDSEIHTQLDGDPGPSLPMEIKVIPKAVKLLVSKDAKPAGIRSRIKKSLGF